MIFVIMIAVLLVRPAGLFGRQPQCGRSQKRRLPVSGRAGRRAPGRAAAVLSVVLVKVLCYALFACAFNLLLGTWPDRSGMLPFGSAAGTGTPQRFGVFQPSHDVVRWQALRCLARCLLYLDPPAGHLLA